MTSSKITQDGQAYMKLTYQRLPLDPESHLDVDQEVEPCHKASRTRTSFIFFIVWNGVLLSFGIIGILCLYWNLQNSSSFPKAISCNCGSSISEAISLGCKYDTLAVAWLPPHCRDDELTAEFDHSGLGPDGAWEFYADREATRVLSVTEISMLAGLPLEEAQFWTTFGWHLSHCSFYWRKEFRMRNKGFMVEHRYDRESHIKHCHMAFLSRLPLNETSTKAVVGLGGDTIGAVRTMMEMSHEHHHEPEQ